jgi:hypothetical protein
MNMRTQTLIDSGTFACFIDKGFVQQHNSALVDKVTLMVVKMMDGQSFFLGHVLYETKALMIIIGSHNSIIVSLHQNAF